MMFNIFFNFQLIQDLKKENFDLKLRLFMEQKEREVGTGLRKNESLFHVAFYSYYTQIEHQI